MNNAWIATIAILGVVFVAIGMSMVIFSSVRTLRRNYRAKRVNAANAKQSISSATVDGEVVPLAVLRRPDSRRHSSAHDTDEIVPLKSVRGDGESRRDSLKSQPDSLKSQPDSLKSQPDSLNSNSPSTIDDRYVDMRARFDKIKAIRDSSILPSRAELAELSSMINDLNIERGMMQSLITSKELRGVSVDPSEHQAVTLNEVTRAHIVKIHKELNIRLKNDELSDK